MDTKIKVTKTERGWAGHFICSDRCEFRRNTLLETPNRNAIIVSTVGSMLSLVDGEGCVPVCLDCYYETMAFEAVIGRSRYADTCREVYFGSKAFIDEEDVDDQANDMHECVVKELTKQLKLDLI